MKKSLLLILILFAAFSSVSYVSASEGNSSEVISQEILVEFTFVKNECAILVPVKFKGKEYLFLLDTGSTHTIFDTSLKHYLGEVKKTTEIMTAGNPVIAEFFDAPEAFLGPLNLQDADEVMCIDIKMLSLIAGKEISGIIGMDFLKKYIIQINFDEGKVLFVAPKKGKKSDWGKKLTIRYSTYGTPFVKGKIFGNKTIYFSIDTGANTTGDLKSKIFKEIISNKQMETSETLTATAGGTMRIKEARIESFSVGSLKYSGLIFGEGNMSRLGLPFLSRHIVTLDFPGKSVYLKPSKEFDKADEVDMSGLHLLRISNEIVVHSVDESSPAQKAGIQANDVIIQINGKDSNAYEMWEVRGILKSREGNKITMTIKRNGEVKDVSFILRKKL